VGASEVTELIKPDEEDSVRLVIFTVALLAIAARERTQSSVENRPCVATEFKNEARSIADAVVEEAKRLSGIAPTKAVCTDCLAIEDSTGKIQHKKGCSVEYIRG